MAHLVVSASGKVLLAGGYLVLDPAYSGVVVSTSSRFYSVISNGKNDRIVVKSPQFINATWSYTWSISQSALSSSIVVSQLDTPAASKNKFVHLALQKTLSLALEVNGPAELERSLGAGLHITIAGDNDFYSQQDQLKSRNLPVSLSSLAEIPPFNPTGVGLADVAKTGLGSSAALITSLVTALLVQTGVIAPDQLASASSRRLAHNVAQFVHCLAQGKVGSGFDVSAAVFGSQLYTRFSPAVLQPIMDDSSGSQSLLSALAPENRAWDLTVTPFTLPPRTRLLLADIHAGSNTPLLVSQVLKWRAANSATAHSLWTALDQCNTSLGRTLARLTELYERDQHAYVETVRWVSGLQPRQWLANPNMQQEQSTCLEAFYEAHLLTEQIRAKMREMGKLSGVEIEPEQQTKLLDASVSMAGVIGGGVPGAGGFDAVWLLVCEPPEDTPGIPPLPRVERLWTSFPGVAPLLAQESKRQGVTLERLDDVPGLAAVVETAARD
ncbi:Phosphomevalonate kinase [Russula earlei]|uniref:Phosphomevalonate kinase n=1 Tax=Russula earlei TaxID=71964 RepID=A0ACC0U2T0_9AGAM|nr:Phosphomevalonate kinase [Russula earlei]